MNSRERILAMLWGEVPDLVPIFPKIAFSSVLACPPMSVREYMTDSASMARAVIAARDVFGWDSLSFHTDIGSEGAALGSVYDQPDDEPSQLRTHLLRDVSEYGKVIPPDPRKTAPMSVVIGAVELAKKSRGAESFILAWTNGPLNVASQVLRIDSLLTAMMDDPAALHRLLERCLETAVAYARELVAAGADAIAFGHALASSTVISRDQYAEFALPYEKRLVAAIREAGAAAATHICGNIEPIADLIAENGSDIVDFDHVCDFEALVRLMPGKLLRGNISPELLAFGTEGQVSEAVRALLERGGKTGRLLLGTGCEVALNTPADNLHAFAKAGRAYGILRQPIE